MPDAPLRSRALFFRESALLEPGFHCWGFPETAFHPGIGQSISVTLDFLPGFLVLAGPLIDASSDCHPVLRVSEFL